MTWSCLPDWHHWNIIAAVQGKAGIITKEQCGRCFKVRFYEKFISNTTKGETNHAS